MINRESIEEIVLAGLAEEGVEPDLLRQSPTALQLIGTKALVKSVGLVALLVGIEQRLYEQLQVQLSLMDEHAMSQSRSLFRSVATLVDYLEQRISTMNTP